jgi:hypothetical protein
MASWLQCESVLEVGQAVAKEHAPSTDKASDVYQWLKSILGTTVVPQAESSLLHWVEASILHAPPPPVNLKDGGQKATQGAPDMGTTFSPEGFSTCDRLGRPSARSEPQTYRRHRPGNDGALS